MTPGDEAATGALRRLVDQDDIARLKARYCRFVDTKRWSDLRTLFTADAVLEGFGSAPNGASVEVFIVGVSARLAECVSIHRCTMPEIGFDGPDQARALWAMQDDLVWPRPIELKEAPGAVGFRGAGYYEDLYRREAGEWRIALSRLTRLYIRPIVGESVPPGGPARCLPVALGPGAGRNDWLRLGMGVAGVAAERRRRGKHRPGAGAA